MIWKGSDAILRLSELSGKEIVDIKRAERLGVLGRGGSDTTAVALAAALKADK
ncbi:hypothetical protein ACQ4LK_18530, partial [Bacillus pumilus]